MKLENQREKNGANNFDYKLLNTQDSDFSNEIELEEENLDEK